MTEFSRLVALDRIGPHHADIEVEANAAELGLLAARLLVPAINRLRCQFHLRRAEGAVIQASGSLDAEVVQVCVVTLEPFEQEVRDEFAIQFIPGGTETDDPDPESVDEVPYAGNALDLGEAATEQLALAMDPYPRRPGAALPSDLLDNAEGPFVGLAALRKLS